MVPSITDVWGYDREFCSSSSSSSPSSPSSSTRTSQKPYNIELGTYQYSEETAHT